MLFTKKKHIYFAIFKYPYFVLNKKKKFNNIFWFFVPKQNIVISKQNGFKPIISKHNIYHDQYIYKVFFLNHEIDNFRFENQILNKDNKESLKQLIKQYFDHNNKFEFIFIDFNSQVLVDEMEKTFKKTMQILNFFVFLGYKFKVDGKEYSENEQKMFFRQSYDYYFALNGNKDVVFDFIIPYDISKEKNKYIIRHKIELIT